MVAVLVVLVVIGAGMIVATYIVTWTEIRKVVNLLWAKLNAQYL